MIAHGVIELTPHVVAKLVLQPGVLHLADPTIEQWHFSDLRCMLHPKHGVHLFNGRLDLHLNILQVLVGAPAQQFLEVPRHLLRKLGLDLEFGDWSLSVLHAVEVDEDACEVGVEFLCGGCDFERHFREVVAVLVVDVVDLAEGVLADVALIDAEEALETDVGQLRVGPQDVGNSLDLGGRYFGLALSVDGEPEGALVEHEVQLHAERHLLSHLPARSIGVAVPASQRLRSRVLDVQVKPHLVLFLEPQEVVVGVEAELVVNVMRSFNAQWLLGVVVLAVEPAHLQQ